MVKHALLALCLAATLAAQTPAGNKLQYVYVNGQLLARIDNSTIYYYHTDQLGTPQAMTDASGAVVWQAVSDPFGKTTLKVQTVVNNIRFPGQYYDQETGLSYNYFRDYDPATGRYVQADPIGFAGGLNLYTYVGGNPISGVDPWGLFDLNFSAGFHVPISPGVAVGPVASSSAVGFSDNPFVPLTSNPTSIDIALGVIADIGVSAGFSDISGTGGKCASPISINFGLGTRSGIQIIPRITPDQTKFIFNPLRYIDGISFGLGLGIASPINVSRGVVIK